jgi:hypothetical protein
LALAVAVFPGPMLTCPLQAATVGADAVVLVNSSSAKYLDFQHYIQPYLDNFGVPYTVCDIATNGVGADLGRYALIVIGHSQLDTNGVALGSTGQDNISLAVSNGTGLVSFDGALATAGGAARYSFVQDIFGFAYGTAGAGASVTLPPTEPQSRMHYITALHATNDTVSLRSSMTLPGLTAPSNVTAVARSGARPLLAVAAHGQGRAAQWTSYDWVSVAVLGPMDGLDDLVWRSLVWAARKPFVMRGLPNFLTLRVDDAYGPFGWAHIASEMGFKPWIGLFLSSISESSAADLRGLVTNGLATTSIHSFAGSTMFYFDHQNQTSYSDSVQSNNFNIGTQWHASHGIPISKVVIAHYSEIGPNAYAGLQAWGVEFMGVCFPPGYGWFANPPSGPPWLIAGPYRLFETPRSGTSNLYPMYYADFYSIPGHPEFDGQFFSCFTEIRDDAGCGEWCPSDTDVLGSIGRGTRQVKRAFDSLILGALYTHEWYVSPISSNNWRVMLQGITNNLAAYKPICVTYDHACQYLRATRTSRLTGGDYDPLSGRVTITMSGSTDLDLQVSVFVGQDDSITSTAATVPAFAGVTTNLAAMLLPPRLEVAVTPAGTVVLTWPNPTPGFVLQQKAGLGAADWTSVTNPPVAEGDTLRVILAEPDNHQFYRLAEP